MSLSDLQTIIQGGGITAFLLFVLVSGGYGVWVFGREYREMRGERDEWKANAMLAAKNAERLIEVLEGGRHSGRSG